MAYPDPHQRILARVMQSFHKKITGFIHSLEQLNNDLGCIRRTQFQRIHPRQRLAATLANLFSPPAQPIGSVCAHRPGLLSWLRKQL
ncbi:MAG: hypothetical protein ACK5OA_09895 [Acidovorax sp.]